MDICSYNDDGNKCHIKCTKIINFDKKNILGFFFRFCLRVSMTNRVQFHGTKRIKRVLFLTKNYYEFKDIL